MIEFRSLPDDNPDLTHSPLLRAALLTLGYAVVAGCGQVASLRRLPRENPMSISGKVAVGEGFVAPSTASTARTHEHYQHAEDRQEIASP